MKAGDVVRLVSGGPRMTVIDLIGRELGDHCAAECIWFGRSADGVHWDGPFRQVFELWLLEPAVGK